MSQLLTNKTYKDSDYVSRYNVFPYYYHVKDNRYVSGITAYLDDSTVYSVYTVKQGDTLDSIALNFYNDPTLYWIICSFNRIRDPFKKLLPESKLRIPSISNIQFDTEGRF